ncbi:ewing's tumor-associated antigen 1, partial [Centroberyx affinis]|uniref:ewing's tumor-associated antigen 1 n=1 Tax=Centroberyx affinis TaxID=166261 RepID=UPI003A5C24DB
SQGGAYAPDGQPMGGFVMDGQTHMGIRPPEHRRQNTELRTQNAERRTQNAELRTQNSEHRTQNSELRTQNSELRTQNTELRTQNAERRTQNSDLRTQNADRLSVPAGPEARGGVEPDPTPPHLTPTPPHPTCTPRPAGLETNLLTSRLQLRKPEADSHELTKLKPDFKTPTRVPRSRYVGGFTGESPQNESEFQQDIIWDATSPSPNRPGKKHTNTGVVDISEIVNRIAPKHGRPKVVEPTLQQWIGDSATIPCTPDVRHPRPKKKSPRPNGVDDLLKLAKQFDFNMFRQDEDEAEDIHQQSLELLSGDILDFENETEPPPLLPETSQPAVNAATVRDSQVQLPLDHHMEDDLDFLFDGPTQQLNGNLSQISIAPSAEVKPAPTVSSRGVSGKDSGPSHRRTSSVSTTRTKGSSVNDAFEDDWENDDLLNDSLVFEMTQNPQNFAVPKHCSTQRDSCEMQYQRDKAVNIPTNGVVRREPENGDGQSAVSKVEKENGKHRMTFRLEANPDFPVKRILTDASTNFKSASDRGVAADAPQISTHKPPERREEPAVPAPLRNNDFPDEDLDSFFSSDSLWDDQEDDDLMCEMCEDLESQAQSVEILPTKQTPPPPPPPPPVGQTVNQRAAPAPSTRAWDHRSQQLNHVPTNPQSASGRGGTCKQSFPKKPTPTSLPSGSSRPAGNSFAGTYGSNCTASLQSDTGKDSYRYMQAKNTSRTNGSTYLQRSGNQSAAAPPPVNHQSQFTFKRPNNPLATVTNKGNLTNGTFSQKPAAAPFPPACVSTAAGGKCSAAEIELKKQQAMERRRQRMRTDLNLRPPT